MTARSAGWQDDERYARRFGRRAPYGITEQQTRPGYRALRALRRKHGTRRLYPVMAQSAAGPQGEQY